MRSAYAYLTTMGFEKARHKALFSRIFAMLKHKSDDLLALNDVLDLLKPDTEVYMGHKTIPLSLIVGSAGRYKDFNRSFLPRHNHLKTKWVQIKSMYHTKPCLPPVSLYQVGGVYFVSDGNHRISVAKSSGAEFIDAEVIGLSSLVQLNPDMELKDLKNAVIAHEKNQFFKRTRLDQLRKWVKIDFTTPGRYDELIKQINKHKEFLGSSGSGEMSFQQALLSWYDEIFIPVVEIIRSEKVLKGFPGRTEADLFVWIAKHSNLLKKRYENHISLGNIFREFMTQYGGFLKSPLF